MFQFRFVPAFKQRILNMRIGFKQISVKVLYVFNLFICLFIDLSAVPLSTFRRVSKIRIELWINKQTTIIFEWSLALEKSFPGRSLTFSTFKFDSIYLKFVALFFCFCCFFLFMQKVHTQITRNRIVKAKYKTKIIQRGQKKK